MHEPPTLTSEDANAWFVSKLPEHWFTDLRVLVDRDEILVVGTIAPDPADDAGPDDAGPDDAGPDDVPPDDPPVDTDDADDAEEARDPEPDAAVSDDRAEELRAIEDFREETREERIRVAQRAEAKFRRKVSWGARCGHTEALFTHLSVPVMTRLRLRERHILDTLVAAGVARSRSDALAWCVRLVAKHEGDWLDELREALKAVDEVRASGPG